MIEIAGAGSIEDIKNSLRGFVEVKEQKQALLHHHEKVQISQGRLREDKRGLHSCYEDLEAKQRRLLSTTPEQAAAIHQAKKCKPGIKARRKMARRLALEALSPPPPPPPPPQPSPAPSIPESIPTPEQNVFWSWPARVVNDDNVIFNPPDRVDDDDNTFGF